MTKRHPNPRLAKIHRNYTVDEVASLFRNHRNTVREWVKRGLPTSDNKRPMLILGRDLSAFLQARRAKNKRPCQPGEIYCVRCRAPKAPAGDMADYQPVTGTLGKHPRTERHIFKPGECQARQRITQRIEIHQVNQLGRIALRTHR